MLEDDNGSRLFLISCVKTKGAMPAAAMDLYTSNWFRKARACVETTGCPWRILSAQYGLVHPEEEIEPYEKTLNTMRVEERRAWADRVLAALVPCLDGVDTVVFLAGQRYRQFLEPQLCERGLAVRVPMGGLRQGQQLAWLNACLRRRRGRRRRQALWGWSRILKYRPDRSPSGDMESRTDRRASARPQKAGDLTLDIRLVSDSELGSFSWRWPEKTEHFERGYAALVRFEGGEFRIRHGISRRTVYGRPRLHSVTWVENRPTVEGVEADDYAHSRSLLSLIKVTKRQLRPTDPLPPMYAGFTVGVMSEEAAGRYSPRSLAVKIRLDDIEGWSRHALLRSAAWGRLGTKRRLRSSLPVTTAPGPGPEEIPAGSGDGHAVASALLQYDSKKREPNSTGSTLDFTPNAEANELLKTDAFAFLTAVLFDQGVPAERAWTAPYLLRQRMGHLDPARIAGDPEGVRRAIQMQPKLHRYIKKMPRWLVGAARTVEQDYHGDASAIWSDRPSAVVLQRRLSEFHGIGQKKAAMAVEILNRDLGVPVDTMVGSDVAVDVHVRRVFLRSRIADRDDRDHMITAARRLHPSRPGALDFPTWDVGRNWCHAGAPDCGHCPLTHVCPKDIERAAGVTSA